MKRRLIALLLALSLALLPCLGTLAEELELFLSTPTPPADDLVLDKSEAAGEKDIIGGMNDANASIIEQLGRKDWTALAEAVEKKGDWREDIVAVAQSQIGYSEEEDGFTIYTTWAEYKEPQPWTALFISWVAEKTGLTQEEFPRLDTYDAFIERMNKLHALKKITRYNYPASGDLALIEKDEQLLIGVVVYVSNGVASVIVGDDNGAVTLDLYGVEKQGFRQYIDLNELMERAGIEVGKGGTVPVIPEGGVAAWTNTNAVYMRSEPTTASARVTTVKKPGTAVIVLSAEKQKDGYIWYGVEYGQYAGYIRGDLLKLDQSELQAAQATPAATPAPVTTPAPGCAVCLKTAQGVALPVACCYAHLAGMSGEEAARFLTSLQENDRLTYRLYLDCHQAHVNGGEAEVISGWHAGDSTVLPENTAGANAASGDLTLQERVVNIVINQPVNADGTMPGEAVTFSFEVYGAKAYQWFQVETRQVIENGVTLQKEVTTMLPDETGTTLTVIAGAEAAGRQYFCEATIASGDTNAVITSKPVTLNVAALTQAQAIIGEEVYFTYNFEGAAKYQWYVQQPGAKAYEALADEAAPQLALTATVEMSGAKYYCAALDVQGGKLGQSSCFTYVIPVYDSYDVDSCLTHDLCKYVNELANMTRAERYAIMTGAWNVPVGGTTMAELVRQHWMSDKAETDHNYIYATLLCTCEQLTEPKGDHGSSCPWRSKTVSGAERETADACKAYQQRLPEEMRCAYAYLKALNAMEQYRFLSELQASNAAAYEAVCQAHDAHVKAGDAALSCICGAEKLQKPGDGHHDGCPWANVQIGVEMAGQAEEKGSLMIRKAGLSKGESTIIRVLLAWEDQTQTLSLVLTGVDQQGSEVSAVVGNLPAGAMFTAAEDAAWNWRNQPSGSMNGVIEPGQTAEVFLDSMVQDRWLHDESGVVCTFGQKN